jgi:transcriptional regulator with XRE-family HTH domain
LPLHTLAAAFARLAGGGRDGDGDEALRRVAHAMTARPDLVGGPDGADAALMLADACVVAKRGAEGVLCAGFARTGDVVGVAVKVVDGSARAAGPAVATALASLGARVPDRFSLSTVAGGGRSQGEVRSTRELRAGLAALEH